MAMIGNGAQRDFRALAFQTVLRIKTVRLYDIDAAATRKAARDLAQSGLEIVEFPFPEEAVAGALTVTTCTADEQYATTLTDNMGGSGIHINAIGGDCPGKTELHRDILMRSDIFVEYPPQTRIEGEIQQLDPDYPVTELWRVIAGEVEGRGSSAQITLFYSVGFATEDFSTLRYERDQLKWTGHYIELDMLADPDDPRDPFFWNDRKRQDMSGASRPGDT